MLVRDANWPPDYTALFAWRQQQLVRFQRDRRFLAAALLYYSTRPVEFIEHWVDTFDPRNAGSNMLVRMPFVLFKRQREMIQFFEACRHARANGLIEKSRTVGATWGACAYSVWMWLFVADSQVGWGSRKQELVDELGVPDSIFEKIRMIIRGLPPPFLPNGFVDRDHLMFMRVINPDTGAGITGECGDNIGRGGRKSLYVKDESAHYEHPELIESALMETADVQIDMSSVNGVGNVFHRKREAGVDWEPGKKALRGRTNVFVFDWRDHPGKSQQWYDDMRREKEDAGLLHLFYQEVDRNYAASVEGVMVHPDWVASCIDAHKKLGFDDSGAHVVALDVADSGGDRNALTMRKGVVLKYADEWGAPDTGVTARKAVEFCRRFSKVAVQYDCIGVGAGVKAEINRLSAERDSQGAMLLPVGVQFVPWDAGAGPLFPEKRVVEHDRQSPINKDFFGNLKAQGWFQLARRAERTHRCVKAGKLLYPADQLMSIDSACPRLRQIQKELSQPVRKPPTGRMKLLVDKTPEGTKSPNIGDSVMMNYWPCRGSYDGTMSWVT